MSHAGSAVAQPPAADSPPQSTASGVRPRLPRFLVVCLSLAALAFALQFFKGLQNIVAPVFLAVNLVLVVYPVQRWLVKRRVPRFIAAAVTVVLVLVLLVSFFGATAWSIAEFVDVLPHYSQKMTELVKQISHGLSSFGVTPEVVTKQLSGLSFSSILNTAMSLLQNFSLAMSLLITAIMAVFFIALDSMQFPHRLKLVSSVRPRFVAALENFSHGVRSYWIVASIFGLIVAVLDVAALWVLQVPLAIVWGVLAFLTNYIPNIGFVVGLVPPALMALVANDWVTAVWVVIAYSVLNFVIQSIIQPKFTGESVGVTPFISFISLLFWVWVLGWLGALLALPATLLLKALLVDADPKAAWVNALIASDVSTSASPDEGDKTAEASHAPVPAGAQVPNTHGGDAHHDGDVQGEPASAEHASAAAAPTRVMPARSENPSASGAGPQQQAGTSAPDDDGATGRARH